MISLAKALTALAALAFVLAVVTHFFGPVILGTQPEAYSRAASNLALIAIALVVTSGDKGLGGKAL